VAAGVAVRETVVVAVAVAVEVVDDVVVVNDVVDNVVAVLREKFLKFIVFYYTVLPDTGLSAGRIEV
jgi:hypothetical protein